MTVGLGRTSMYFRVSLPDALRHLAGGLKHYETDPPEAEREPVRLKISQSGDALVVTEPGFLELRAPVEQISLATLQMMVDLAYYRMLDDDGIAVLHASVVSDGSATYALWGSSGAGKTTTALAMRERYGFSVLSNGTAMFRLDADGSPLFVGTAKGHVKLRSSSVPTGSSGWAARPDPSEPGYELKAELSLTDFADVSVRPPLGLTGLVAIRLVRGLPAADLQPVGRARAGVELYEDVVRHLHGLTAVLPDATGRRLARLPVLGSDRTHDARRRLISRLLDHGWSLSGPLDAVTGVLAAGLSGPDAVRDRTGPAAGRTGGGAAR